MAPAWKVGIRGNSYRGFESLSLRHRPLTFQFSRNYSSISVQFQQLASVYSHPRRVAFNLYWQFPQPVSSGFCWRCGFSWYRSIYRECSCSLQLGMRCREQVACLVTDLAKQGRTRASCCRCRRCQRDAYAPLPRACCLRRRLHAVPGRLIYDCRVLSLKCLVPVSGEATTDRVGQDLVDLAEAECTTTTTTTLPPAGEATLLRAQHFRRCCAGCGVETTEVQVE